MGTITLEAGSVNSSDEDSEADDANETGLLNENKGVKTEEASFVAEEHNEELKKSTEKKIAKVPPFTDEIPYSENANLLDEVSELSVSSEFANQLPSTSEKSKKPLLRIRNFATDPARQELNTNIPSVSAVQTWHEPTEDAEVNVVHQKIPSETPKTVFSFTKFGRVSEEHHRRYKVNAGAGVAEKYVIFTTTEKISVRLFIHESKLKDLSSLGWSHLQSSDAAVNFLPNEKTPRQISFTFGTGRGKPAFKISANLPDLTQVCEEIRNRRMFALSPTRLEMAGKLHCSVWNSPLISHAIDIETFDVFRVDLSKNAKHPCVDLFDSVKHEQQLWQTRKHAVAAVNFALSACNLEAFGQSVEEKVFKQTTKQTYLKVLRAKVRLFVKKSLGAFYQCQHCRLTFSIHDQKEQKTHLVKEHFMEAIDYFFKHYNGNYGCYFTTTCKVNSFALKGDFLHHVFSGHGKDIFGVQADMLNMLNWTSNVEVKSHLTQEDSSSSSANELLQTFACPICGLDFQRAFSLGEHLARLHFYHGIDNIIGGSSGNLICSLDQCTNVNFNSRQTYITHLGMEHGLIDKYLKELKSKMEPFGGIRGRKFECVLNCKSSEKFYFYDLLDHLANSHHRKKLLLCGTWLKNCLKPTTGCGVDGCLVKDVPCIISHLAFFHLEIIGEALYACLQMPNGSKDVQVFRDAALAFNEGCGRVQYPCDDCQVVFFSKTYRDVHRCTEHHFSELQHLLKDEELCESCKPTGNQFEYVIHVAFEHQGLGFLKKPQANQTQCSEPAATVRTAEDASVLASQWHYKCPMCKMKIRGQTFDNGEQRFLRHLRLNHLNDAARKDNQQTVQEFIRKTLGENFMAGCMNWIYRYRCFLSERAAEEPTASPHLVNVFLNCAFGVFKATFPQLQKMLDEIDKGRRPFISGGAEIRLKDHPLIIKTMAAIKRQTQYSKVTNILSTQPPPSKNLEDRKFKCNQCNMSFGGVESVVQHVQGRDLIHNQGTIQCVYCEEVFSIITVENIARFLVVHTFSQSHLHNRWINLFSKDKRQALRASDNYTHSETGKIPRCIACSADVNVLNDHVTSKQHVDSSFVVNHFVGHCDLRQVSPVTCSIKEVTFFLSNVFPKTRQNGAGFVNVALYQILSILSRVHDLVDEADLSANNTISDHVSSLIASSSVERRLPRFRYVCYSCPFQTISLKDLKTHVESVSHRMAKMGTNNQDVLRCDCCNASLKNFQQAEYHSYSREHLRQSFATEMLKESFENREGYCHACMKSAELDHHQSEEHLAAVHFAEAYMEFCQNQGELPTVLSKKNLVNFFTQYPNFKKDGELDNAKVANAVMFVSQIHDGFEGKKINESPELVMQFSADKSPIKQLSKTEKLPYTDCLKLEHVELVTKCDICDLQCGHATFLMIHVFAKHQLTPRAYCEKIKYGFIHAKDLNEELICSKCVKKCASPMALALHHDKHFLKDFHICGKCKKNFMSYSNFYQKDFCGENDIPQVQKNEIENGILEIIRRTPDTGQIGTPVKPSAFLVLEDSDEKAEQAIEHNSVCKDSDEIFPTISKNVTEVRVVVTKAEKRVADEALHEISAAPPLAKRPKVDSRPESPVKTNLSTRQSPKDVPRWERAKNGVIKMPLFAKNDDFFCLDCEGCSLANCNHLSHPRIFIGSDIAKHLRETNHSRLQPVRNFVSDKLQIQVEDMALNRSLSREYRTKLRKLMRDHGYQPLEFEKERKCRKKGCSFYSQSGIDLILHLRTHLRS